MFISPQALAVIVHCRVKHTNYYTTYLNVLIQTASTCDISFIFPSTTGILCEYFQDADSNSVCFDWIIFVQTRLKREYLCYQKYSFEYSKDSSRLKKKHSIFPIKWNPTMSQERDQFNEVCFRNSCSCQHCQWQIVNWSCTKRKIFNQSTTERC